jgi:hypothetical protein
MKTGIYLGAYAAAQPTAEFLRELHPISGVRGLEVPFLGPDEDALRILAENTPPQWSFILTLLPGTMARLQTDERFGLASVDGPGRDRAVELASQARQSVVLLNERLGRRAVVAVEIHSAPKLGAAGQVGSSGQAFLRSLDELREWDWQGAELWIEHCDAFQLGREPAKGFMTLEREMEALGGSSGRTPCGFSVNWGRSAIEGRSVATPIEHLELLRKSHLLRGLIFSGVTRGNALYGDWADTHAPFEAQGSLLGANEVKAALAAAGGAEALKGLGLKMQALPASLTLPERVEFVRAQLRFLEQC